MAYEKRYERRSGRGDYSGYPMSGRGADGARDAARFGKDGPPLRIYGTRSYYFEPEWAPYYGHEGEGPSGRYIYDFHESGRQGRDYTERGPNRRGAGGRGTDERAGTFTGRGPRNYRRSDERIREDINERLTDDPDLDASEVEVTVEGGVVTLRGAVAGRWEKRRAADIAESVSGVSDVNNSLRVSMSSQTTPIQ